MGSVTSRCPLGRLSMTLKIVVTVALLAAFPIVAQAQQKPPAPAANMPKPTAADIQKLVQTISADKAKVKTYCDIGGLQDQMDQAEKKKDTKTLQALGAKVDELTKQLGPDYEKVMGGLDQVDPNSAEGKKFTALFEPLFKQCK
jgi:hypothetical protein